MLRQILLAGALATAGAATGDTRPPVSSAAAPEIILVYGTAPAERWVIADWGENQKLLASLGQQATVVPPGPRAPFGERRGLQLALYWGTRWRATAEAAERLRTLAPEQATQRGWYYPASGGAPAVVSLGEGFRVVSDSGLAVLRRHAVPTRLP